MLEQWRRGQDVDRLNEMNLDDKSIKIFTIRTCLADDLLWMDQFAFLSLKIFSQESHPSAFKKGHSQSAKEGWIFVLIQWFLSLVDYFSSMAYKVYLRSPRNCTG
jgi:hypothetical protein